MAEASRASSWIARQPVVQADSDYADFRVMLRSRGQRLVEPVLEIARQPVVQAVSDYAVDGMQ